MSRVGVLDMAGMPTAVEAERFLLGAALNSSDAFSTIIGQVEAGDFSLEKHRRIFVRIQELFERGETPASITVGLELKKHGELEGVDGLSYLTTLADETPRLSIIENLCRTVHEKSILRKAIRASETVIQRCLAATDAPEELLCDAERITDVLTGCKNQKTVARTVAEIMASEGGINKFLKPEARPGLYVPFESIHETLGGLRRGKYIILGANPMVGKTAFASQVAEHIASNGSTVVIVTNEMTGRDLLYRSITGRAQVSAYKFLQGRLSPIEISAVNLEANALLELKEHLLIAENVSSVSAVSAMLRSLQARGNAANLVIVDYLQLLVAPDHADNRVQEVSTISRGLKRITQQFDIPLLAISQFSRQQDRKEEPQLHWLKESGQLEYDADQVLFFWLKKEAQEGDVSREVSWKVAKNRDGMLNRGTLQFFTKYCRFVEEYEREAVA